MWKEFKEFAIRGSAIDLAVGVVIGAAFTSIVNSLVQDIFNPILGLFTGRVDLGRWTIGLPGDSVLRFGAFLNAIINFLIVSFAIFLIIKHINRFRKSPSEVAHMKACPFCKTAIDKEASRCPACTSQLN